MLGTFSYKIDRRSNLVVVIHCVLVVAILTRVSNNNNNSKLKSWRSFSYIPFFVLLFFVSSTTMSVISIENMPE